MVRLAILLCLSLSTPVNRYENSQRETVGKKVQKRLSLPLDIADKYSIMENMNNKELREKTKHRTFTSMAQRRRWLALQNDVEKNEKKEKKD